LQSRSLLVSITDTNTTPASQEQGESKHLRISVQQSESGESVGDQRQGRTWLREQGRSASGGLESEKTGKERGSEEARGGKQWRPPLQSPRYGRSRQRQRGGGLVVAEA